MATEAVEVNDVGLIDHVTRMRRWAFEKTDGRTVTREQSQQHPIPEETMTALEKHIGDAQAKVTVGCELGHSKEYGCKAGSFVSVSVTCNNAEDDITAVHSIIQPLARKLANEDLDQMKLDRDDHMGGPVSAPVGKVAAAPRAHAKPPTATKPAGTKPPAAAPVATKPGVQRPSFRR